MLLYYIIMYFIIHHYYYYYYYYIIIDKMLSFIDYFYEAFHFVPGIGLVL